MHCEVRKTHYMTESEVGFCLFLQHGMFAFHLESARNFSPNKLPAIAKSEATVVHTADFQRLSRANHYFMGV